MARPDLKDPEPLGHYRRELRAYLRPWRIVGLIVVRTSYHLRSMSEAA